eukprot:CAMPEP_0174364250 /NCGR_PEP_ID=MMETSP0811_2-20130205/72103_1 /TAXON_ID=73025 ORGANISM="Eutreptiella gymnastica-like, Strain CCMP1594" /NCGR_SAMPLE_ID=MMETSP0811_2 /ASSEMBLY_ACC=CAM_ASM_000667 /LENGTH=32 /DNA_ID= /DNA_START= /DNA_END= /DNA_ORIENTATION=
MAAVLSDDTGSVDARVTQPRAWQRGRLLRAAG